MQRFKRQQKFSISYNDPHCILYISNYLYSLLSLIERNITVLCIGTDRSTGDSYGPLTGTFLSQNNLKHVSVKGTLDNPVHALNIEDTIESIYQEDHNAFIIAIDASLGQIKSIGHIFYGVGKIEPGKAVKKNLPSVGDLFITSVVNVGGLMEYATLQSTRLSLVYNMAYKTAKILQLTDYYLSKNSPHLAINK